MGCCRRDTSPISWGTVNAGTFSFVAIFGFPARQRHGSHGGTTRGLPRRKHHRTFCVVQFPQHRTPAKYPFLIRECRFGGSIPTLRRFVPSWSSRTLCTSDTADAFPGHGLSLVVCRRIEPLAAHGAGPQAVACPWLLAADVAQVDTYPAAMARSSGIADVLRGDDADFVFHGITPGSQGTSDCRRKRSARRRFTSSPMALESGNKWLFSAVLLGVPLPTAVAGLSEY